MAKTNWQTGNQVGAADLNTLGAEINDLSAEIAGKLTDQSGPEVYGLYATEAGTNSVYTFGVAAAPWSIVLRGNDGRTSVGTPTDPSHAATKGYVDTAIAAAQTVAVNTQTGTAYTLVLSDASRAVECSNGAAITLTVPPNSSIPFPVGTVIEVVQVGAGQVTVAAGSGVTINAAASLKTRAQWSVLTLRKRGTDTWLLAGDAE